MTPDDRQRAPAAADRGGAAPVDAGRDAPPGARTVPAQRAAPLGADAAMPWPLAGPRWLAGDPVALGAEVLTTAAATAAALDLREAGLEEGDFRDADLADADLRRASLRGATLAGARLRGARLHAADLCRADLRGADLRGADLQGADLRGADLRGAVLAGAAWDDAAFGAARLAGADVGPAAPPLGEVQRREDVATLGAAMAAEAIALGRRMHAAGRLGAAGRAYADAAAWEPGEALGPWLEATVALERGDGEAAIAALERALAREPAATRVRLGLAALWLDQGAATRAAAHLAEVAQGEGVSAEAKGLAAGALAALAAAGGSAVSSALAALGQGPLADDPCLRFARRLRRRRPPLRGDDTAARLDDPAWIAAEQGALEALLQDRDLAAAPLHTALARALTIGAMELAALAELRLRRVEPEAALWSLQLRQLDATAEAFAALVRTRVGPDGGGLGTVSAVRWVALGGHGPTARVETEAGVFYAKRLFGAHRPPQSVAFGHRLLRTLAAASLRVPVPLPDRSGDDVLVFGDDLLALYPRLTGVSIGDDDLTSDEAADAGALLAAVHRASAPLAAASLRARGVVAGSRVVRSVRPSSAFAALIGGDAAAAAWYDAWPGRAGLEGRLDALGRRLHALVPRLAPAVVHGDFGAGNVLRDASGAMAVVDWELAGVDVAVWDLARAIDRGAVHWPALDPVEVRGDIARAWLAGYQRERPLSADERRLLPLLVAASRVDLDASLVPRLAVHAPEAAELLLTRLVRRLEDAVAGSVSVAHALAS